MSKPKKAFVRIKAFGCVTTMPMTFVRALEKVCRKYSHKKEWSFKYDVKR
jgi:hypothetical protein